MSKNIALVGFMGAGKSVVAKNLATALKRKLVSTDEAIVERTKRPIVDIFRDSGEAYFRDVEKEVVQNLSRQSNLVIDCGGGVVIDHENIRNLKGSGVLIYLAATPDVIYERVRGEKHRPLLNVPDPKAKIAELLAARKSKYEQAHHTVDTSGKTIKEVTNEILSLLAP